MEEKLKKIFQNSYPGINVFISEVLTLIFSEDFIEEKHVNLIDSEEIRKRANNANILSAYHVADIDRIDSDPVAVYDVTLKPNSKITHSRVAIRQFITALSMTYTHIFIVFHYENEPDRPWRFSYVYKESSIAGTRETAKRYTYVFGKDYPSRTAIDRFIELADSSKTDADFAKAFSVETLSNEFFDKYREHYADFVQYITGKRYVKESNKWVERTQCEPNVQYNSTFDCDDKLVRDYIKKMFGRIVFLYFLQRKGWLAKNKQYMHDLYYNSEHKDNFLDKVLEPLFFEVLNTDKKYRTPEAKKLPDSDNIPYLNGGLFARDEIDELQCVFPEKRFKDLFDFLDRYNFTIDENDPEDAEVGIDPEMLGRIFENLLEDNKDKGAFYTPKEIVDYMCRESIIAYLINDIPERSHQLIRSFVEDLDAEPLNDKQRIFLRRKLQSVKICDPAIGSGAFPMGLVNLLSKLYIALKSDTDTVKMKRHIMENNIYGVDIEKGAVDIARLRFWLAMIVEEKEPMPLPNLHFKIMQGNSLLESYMGVDLSNLTNFENSGAQRIFNFGDDAERQDLVNKLKSYYKTSDHNERDRLFNGIKNNVYRQLYAKGITLPSGMDPSANEKFFLWHTWFSDVFEKGGFDIIIGNPPYIKEGRMSKTFFEPYKKSFYYKGKMDIWYLFACNGLDLLNTNGVFCFIATNNWVTSFGASKLRDKVIKETRICNIVDFGAVMMFESASIQTMIMMFQKDKNTDDYTFDYRKLTAYKATEKEAIAILAPSYKTYDQAECYTPTIRRANLYGKNITFSQSDDILNKIYNVKNNIFLFEEELTNGIHPHYDFINKKLSEKYGFPIGDGIFGLSKSEIDGLDLSEDEVKLIKPYYNSSDNVARYTIGATDINIIYTPSTFKNPHSMDSYPHLKAHLDKFKDVISSDNKPYGLHRARVESFFIGEKIVALRKCAGKPVFAYANGLNYMSATFYVIKTNRVNMKYLTGLLNSKLIEFWLKNKGKMQGANYQLDKEPLQQIPIAVPSDKMQEAIVKIVDNILNIKKENILADTIEYEKQIDIIVYHLYGLTYNEILMIDSETPITKEEYDSYIINNEK